ncbi:protein tyrosine kinase [Ancylostoma caninum]|uniref:Protein tyrosine kinase n=1 Tax=Ancylostoma caninum TaxID=29170 RepID=A0A368H5J0_ANCCA|nr:protein tyrosine kinase [Ancylostoma caninum]
MSVENSHALWKEARVMQMYDHPHVVRMYGVANDTEPYYLVMELVTGGALNDFLKKKGKYAKTAKRVQILYEASLGIEYLHSKGCIHRDIAARNLLMDKVVKVADFGLTRRSKSYIVNPDKPMNLRWLAPDVYHTGIVEKHTDVYAFGVTMWEVFQIPYHIPYREWDADEVSIDFLILSSDLGGSRAGLNCKPVAFIYLHVHSPILGSRIVQAEACASRSTPKQSPTCIKIIAHLKNVKNRSEIIFTSVPAV